MDLWENFVMACVAASAVYAFSGSHRVAFGCIALYFVESVLIDIYLHHKRQKE